MSGWDDLVADGVARRDVELAPLTTYKLGGPCDFLVEVDRAETLEAVGEIWRAEPRQMLVLGRGSNLLVADSGFRGAVVRLGTSFASLSVDQDGIAHAGGSLSFPLLARTVSKEGRGGLEYGVGIPGSVGGAVRQNAGCFGREVVDVLVDAEVVSLTDGGRKWRGRDELHLAYRHSNIASDEIVVSARFATVATDPADSAEEMRRITRWRRDHQPGGTLNAGSVFKNPADVAAGALIDQLGLKGYSVGPVRVSPRHANFIEAEPGATATQVRTLIESVQTRVEEETGRVLEPEIQFVGFDGDA